MGGSKSRIKRLKSLGMKRTPGYNTVPERDPSVAAYPDPTGNKCWMIAWTLRALGQLSEALEIQLRLEREYDEAGEPDPYVFEELELLYQAINDKEKAEFYANRRNAIK